MTASATNAASDRYAVGVDVGGTHTDLILASSSGLARGKAFTTHDDYSQGILDALATAAGQIELGPEEVLARCDAFVNATTIVTNVLTEHRGAKVGVLITRGFRDTFRIAGGARTDDYDDQRSQVPPPEVVARDCIEEIDERVDREGTVLVPLDEQQVRLAARRLREQGVEAVAVCYLWSFLGPEHERRSAEILAEELPDAFVTPSCDLHPVIREHERFATAVLNCFSHAATTRFLDALEGRLGSGGFAGSLSYFQGIGGSVGGDVVRDRPITLLGSGPAGGVMGARLLAERLGLQDVLVGDMGGTSFDTSVLAGREPTIVKRARFGRYQTGTTIVDVMSVGSGGGSIAWLDARGVPQVGPRSAGSQPGPACYGRGGTEPTVTDAMLAMGFIDPHNYLRGRYVLDADASRRALAERIADPLGWPVERAAAAIHDLAVTNMAGALREVTIERGHDPRDFTMVAYGGMLPLFAVEICRRLGCPRIVIPHNSSAFSAYGVLTADYKRQYEQTVQWYLSDAAGCGRVNEVFEQLVAQARANARAEGVADGQLAIERSAELRFDGQTFEVSVPMPDRALTPADAERLAAEFPRVYERRYGAGTAWQGSPVLLLNVAVTASHRRPKPVDGDDHAPAGEPQPFAAREVFVPRERRALELPIYAEADLGAGASVAGPCIVDANDTTIFVPVGVRAERDAQRNFHVTLAGGTT